MNQTTGSKRGRFFSRFTGNDATDSSAKKQKIDHPPTPTRDKENQTPVKSNYIAQLPITSPSATVHYGVISNMSIF